MTNTRALLLVITAMLFTLTNCNRQVVNSNSQPISHELWEGMLKKYVDKRGNVNYAAFKEDSASLNTYLKLLSDNHPNEANWTRNERLAYWINAYNAFTVKLVADHYPLKSIKDIKSGIPFINSVWDIKFFEIGGKKFDLNEIEHSILRKEFNEPRIHFAIVCASISCPELRNEAYTPEKLIAQLDEQAVLFINDSKRNRMGQGRVQISKIFSWFKGDFTKEGTIIQYLNNFSFIKIEEDAVVEYLEYDWGLNGE